MNKLKKHTVQMTVTMTKEYYDILTELANSKYLKVNDYVQKIITNTVLDEMTTK